MARIVAGSQPDEADERAARCMRDSHRLPARRAPEAVPSPANDIARMASLLPTRTLTVEADPTRAADQRADAHRARPYRAARPPGHLHDRSPARGLGDSDPSPDPR